MQSPYMFIVKPLGGKRYSNTRDVNGKELIVSTSEEAHEHSERMAKVVSLPINYEGPIIEGDLLLVHHNVFKFYNDMYGNTKSGRSYFKDDLFFVDSEQFFLYKHDGKWHAHDRFCFVKPIKVTKSMLLKRGVEEPLVGEIRYINQQLLNMGLNEGDTVVFEPESDYEFTVDGEKLYRMFTNNITMTI